MAERATKNSHNCSDLLIRVGRKASGSRKTYVWKVTLRGEKVPPRALTPPSLEKKPRIKSSGGQQNKAFLESGSVGPGKGRPLKKGENG